MNRRELKIKLRRIEQHNDKILKQRVKMLSERDEEYKNILREIDNDYDLLISMVRYSHFKHAMSEALEELLISKEEDDGIVGEC